MLSKISLFNFVGYCDLASFQRVNPDNEKFRPKNTWQPKSARASPLSNPKFLIFHRQSHYQPSTLNFGRRVLNGQNPLVLLADQL